MNKLLLIFAVALVSCGPQERTMDNIQDVGDHTQIIPIDGCEYIRTTSGRMDGGVCIIHKQNCKSPIHKY